MSPRFNAFRSTTEASEIPHSWYYLSSELYHAKRSWIIHLSEDRWQEYYPVYWPSGVRLYVRKRRGGGRPHYRVILTNSRAYRIWYEHHYGKKVPFYWKALYYTGL